MGLLPPVDKLSDEEPAAEEGRKDGKSTFR